MAIGSGTQENTTAAPGNTPVSLDKLTAMFAELHERARRGEEQTRQAEADMTALEAWAIEHGYSVDDALASLMAA
jgi:hypothetical protein